MRGLAVLLLLMPSWLLAQVTVQMEKRDGVFYVPCKVNGLTLKFIFDTGASNVSISLAEAMFMMKNGYLLESDVAGSQRYQMANGEIEEGVVVNLRQIEIGGRKFHNIKASVSRSLTAPLLLGSTALEGFGTVSVNYQSAILTLGQKDASPVTPFVGTAKRDEGCKDADGHVYKVVTIGAQTWMAENLRTTKYQNGEQLYSDESGWPSERGTYTTYEGKPANALLYGLLYNWHAVNDPRGICPRGWHIPSDEEWRSLVGFLGGEERAGGQLKGTLQWEKPNFGATNSSGFNALPGGYRNERSSFGKDKYIVENGHFDIIRDEGFEEIKERAYFWSQTMDSKPSRNRYGGEEVNALYFTLYSKFGDAHLFGALLGDGLSCRCLRD